MTERFALILFKASVMNLHDDNPTGENDKKLRRIFENNGIDVNQGDAAALYLNIPREKPIF